MMTNPIPRAIRVFFVLSLVAPVPALAQSVWDEVRCDYTRRAICDKTGCRDLAIRTAFLIVPPLDHLRRAIGDHDLSPAVRRCDDKGCTPVMVQVVSSGIFLNVAAPQAGYILKVASSSVDLAEITRGEFVEVATQLLSTYIGYGRCKFANQ